MGMRGHLRVCGCDLNFMCAIERYGWRNAYIRRDRDFNRLRKKVVENSPGGSPYIRNRSTDNKLVACTRGGNIQKAVFFGVQIRQFRGLVGWPISVLPQQLRYERTFILAHNFQPAT